MKYVDLKEHQNARLAFEALKYLGSLLCHKKFATEFTNAGKLLYMQVYRKSIVKGTFPEQMNSL